MTDIADLRLTESDCEVHIGLVLDQGCLSLIHVFLINNLNLEK